MIRDKIATISEIGSSDARSIGSKAAYLGELARNGFPVPPGVVLWPSFADLLVQWATTLGQSTRKDRKSPVKMLEEALRGVNCRTFAVRSSFVGEDMPGASFAGQYRTILGVPLKRLPGAVAACSKAQSPEALTGYRKLVRSEVSLRPAIIVQKMVWSVATGTAMSHSVNDPTHFCIEIWRERPGQRIRAVRPERIHIARDFGLREDESAIGQDVVTVCRLLRRLELQLGFGVEAEFALSRHRIWVLQVRHLM